MTAALAGCVRAVVVSWNGAHLLSACLDSLLAQGSDRLHEVVVVDNGSTDTTADLLAQSYPQVRVIRTAENLGFAGGVAAGLADLDTEFALLLNNDATLQAGALDRLIGAAGPEAGRVGAVTAKILLDGWYRPADGAGGRVLSDGRRRWASCAADETGAVRLVNSTGNVVDRDGAGHDRDWLAPDGSERGGREVLGFCGGAALLRASALRAAGGFDPWLFLYYEDTDLSWRLRAHGWRIVYESGAVAWHRHAASSDTASPVFRFHNTRNALVVAGRHAPATVVLRAWARAAAGVVRSELARTEPVAVRRARRRGLAAAAARVPRTLHERRAAWSKAPVARSEVARLLGQAKD